MNKLILFILFSIASLTSTAQLDNRVFTVSSGIPYQYLSSPTVVTTSGWDDFSATIPLGFMFNLLGDSTNTLHFDDNDMNTGTDLQFSTTTLGPNPFNVLTMIIDLEDRNTYVPTQVSTVGYKTDVVGGKKITKIEWRNAGLYDDSLHVDSMNAQLWLYEENDAIEYRIGKSSRNTITALLKDPSIYGLKGAIFGFFKRVDPSTFTLENFYFASNLNPATMDSADANTLFNNPAVVGTDSFPNSNTLLRWAPATPNGVNSVALNNNISVFPTVVEQDLHIRLNKNDDYLVQLYNAQGQLVRQQQLSKLNETLDMKACTAGNYFIVFSDKNERITYQICKK
jgi:hypothetical protein